MDEIDYTLTKQHFSAKIYKSYLQYISKNYPSINIPNLCKKAGLPADHVYKADGWVSIDFNSRFMNEIKNLISDPEFEYKVGVASFSKEIMGPVYYIMKNVLTLEEIYNNIWKFPKFFNKVLSFDSIKKGSGEVTIRIKANLDGLSNSEVQQLKLSMTDIVNNSLGYYSGFAKSKKIDSAKITAVCVNEFEYNIEVRYPLERSKFFGGTAYPIIFGLVSFFSSNFFLKNNLEALGLGLLAAWMLFSYSLRKRNLELAEAANNAEDTLTKLDNQYKTLIETKISLQRKLSESDAINELTNTLIQSSSEEEILQKASDQLTNILDFDRVMIMMDDPSKKFLEVKAYSITDKNLKNKIQSFRLSIDIDSNDSTKVSNIYKSGVPVLIQDVGAHISTLNIESQKLLAASKSKSFVGVPIRSSTTSYGVLLADTFYKDRKLTTEDMNILTLAGQQIAITLEKQRAQADVVKAYEELNALSKSYSRFVPFEAIKLLGFESVKDIKMEAGKEINMAIVFCDIRGFTSMSEAMSPVDTMSFLNSYFSHLAPIFHNNNGIIDKFMGDGIMALFLNPTDAFKASAEFQLALDKYNSEHRSGGAKKLIKTGMGIHFGKVLLGAVGYEDRMSISVVSDAVNLTSRLDGLTKKFGVEILCSEEAYLGASDIDNFRLIAELKVDGRAGLTKIYEYFGHMNEESRRKRRGNRKVIEQLVAGELPLKNLESSTLDVKSDAVVGYYYGQLGTIKKSAS